MNKDCGGSGGEADKVSISYNPGIYDVGTMQEAMAIILSPEQNKTVEQRWKDETPYLGELMERVLGLTEDSLLLDYGCGVGRMSKEMIGRTRCRAVGVDYSTNMRALAANYVDNPNFLAMDASWLPVLGLKAEFDAAIAVWCLQHCLDPMENINQIYDAIKPGGKLFVLNDIRFVPTNVGFVEDNIDVPDLLGRCFTLVETIKLSPSVITPLLADRAHCAVYEK